MAGKPRKKAASTAAETEVLVLDGHEVAITNPHKILFPDPGHTKLDLVRYYRQSPRARSGVPAAGPT